MKLTVYRIRTYVTYEYSSDKTIDTSAFPECAGMDAAQRLRWCLENPSRVWHGDFEPWLTDVDSVNTREGDATMFLHAAAKGSDALMSVRGAVFKANEIGNTYPRTPSDDEVAAARARMEEAYKAALAAADRGRDEDEDADEEAEGEDDPAPVPSTKSKTTRSSARAPAVASSTSVQSKTKPAAASSRLGGMHAALTATDMQRETHTIKDQTFELVHCPPGTFTMGSPEDEPHRQDVEGQHEVTLTRAFALGVVPVTQALWEAVTGKNPSNCKDGDDAPQRPVHIVSWRDSVRFCNALSANLGLAPAYVIGKGTTPTVTCDLGASGFRLPTEAEWEYAARSGGDAFLFAGSDDLDEVGWYLDNLGDFVGPQSVAGKRPTRWGLYDMSGNVWEWCWDVRSGASDGQVTDPVGAQSGPFRVVRGGSWYRTADRARAAFRGGYAPGARESAVGLRLARTIA